MSRIDALTKEIKSLKKVSDRSLLNHIYFTRLFNNYLGSLWWMLDFYDSGDAEEKTYLESEFGHDFPDSLSNGDLLEIGKFIKKWRGEPEERTPGWIHYMERLQARVKIAQDNLTLATQRLKFAKSGVDEYIIPDLANIVVSVTERPQTNRPQTMNRLFSPGN